MPIPKEQKALILDHVPGMAPLLVELADEVGIKAKAVSSIAAFKDSFTQIQPSIICLDCEIPQQDIPPLMVWMSSARADRAIPPPKLILVSATEEQSILLKKYAENIGIQVVAEFDKTADIDEVREVLKSVT